MQKITLPLIQFGITRTTVLASVVLIVMHAAAWLIRNRIIDGQTIVTILAIVSVTNLALFILIKTQFHQFARLILLSVYMFHILYFLLSLIEWRKL